MRHEPKIVAEMREFSVEDCASGERQAVMESSFEAAAIGFLERRHGATEGEIMLAVMDETTGRTEHFRLHV
jgi:hypothetical protein